jgi:hypothetical protein
MHEKICYALAATIGAPNALKLFAFVPSVQGIGNWSHRSEEG